MPNCFDDATMWVQNLQSQLQTVKLGKQQTLKMKQRKQQTLKEVSSARKSF